jgi:hypothetical protein
MNDGDHHVVQTTAVQKILVAVEYQLTGLSGFKREALVPPGGVNTRALADFRGISGGRRRFPGYREYA